MKINTRVRYGVRTMVELALEKNRKGIFQKEISKNQDISIKYLDQIIASLKAAGLIENAGGRKSGYLLSRKPEKISVYDIYKAFESDLRIIDCLGSNSTCSKEHQCAAQEFWTGLNEHVINYLESETLDNLAAKQEEINKNTVNMFYI